MSDIYAICTHKTRPSEAADAWKEHGICAIGFQPLGNLKHARRRFKKDGRRFPKEPGNFLGIKRHDMILAYSKRNTIAYVGRVTDGRYMHNEKNEVGRDFGSPNQLKVDWWLDPSYFERSQLPPWLSQQLAKPHKTLIKLELDRHGFGFDQSVGIIRNCARSLSAFDEQEDLVKAGLRKYLHQRRLRGIEAGLQIVGSEFSVSREDIADFRALDRNGNTVLIECKGIGHEAGCEQLKRYGDRYDRKGTRLMLIAFRFDNRCLKLARSKGIELVKCDLAFEKL